MYSNFNNNIALWNVLSFQKYSFSIKNGANYINAYNLINLLSAIKCKCNNSFFGKHGAEVYNLI